MKDSDIHVLFKHHVASHQDEVKAFDELDEWETANYWADRHAKDALRDYMEDGCPKIVSKISNGDNWLLTLNKVPVTSNIKRTIYDAKWLTIGKEF